MSNKNDTDNFDNRSGNTPDFESENAKSTPGDNYIMEELNVIQIRLKELEEDRQILYNLSQEQKERINDLNTQIGDCNKSRTILLYGGIIMVVSILLMVSYFIF